MGGGGEGQVGVREDYFRPFYVYPSPISHVPISNSQNKFLYPISTKLKKSLLYLGPH